MTDRHAAWRQHGVHATLDDLLRLLADAIKNASGDADAITELRRIQAVAVFIQARLAAVDSKLVQAGVLDRLQMTLKSVTAAIHAFEADKVSAHLQEANVSADDALGSVAAMNLQLTKRDFAAARVSATEYAKDLETELARARELSGKVVADLTTAKATLSADLDAFKTTAQAEVSTTIDDLRKDTTAFRANAESSIGTLQTDATTLFNGVRSNTEQLHADLTGSFATAQTAVTNEVTLLKESTAREAEAIRAKQTELVAEIASERQRLSSLVAEYQGQFSKAQEKRLVEWNDAQRERQESLSRLTAEYEQQLKSGASDLAALKTSASGQYTDSLTALKSKYESDADALLGQIKAQKEEADKLLSIIGERGVTSGFQGTADDARKRTVLWQWAASIAMALLVGVAVYAFLPSMNGTFNWGSFAGRVFVTLTVGVFAGYAATQADRYQKVDRENRRRALELAAIGPFIAPLPPDEQQRFRISYGERQFGQNNDLIGEGADKSPATAIALVVQLLKNKEVQDVLRTILTADRLK